MNRDDIHVVLQIAYFRATDMTQDEIKEKFKGIAEPKIIQLGLNLYHHLFSINPSLVEELK